MKPMPCLWTRSNLCPVLSQILPPSGRAAAHHLYLTCQDQNSRSGIQRMSFPKTSSLYWCICDAFPILHKQSRKLSTSGYTCWVYSSFHWRTCKLLAQRQSFRDWPDEISNLREHVVLGSNEGIDEKWLDNEQRQSKEWGGEPGVTESKAGKLLFLLLALYEFLRNSYSMIAFW